MTKILLYGLGHVTKILLYGLGHVTKKLLYGLGHVTKILLYGLGHMTNMAACPCKVKASTEPKAAMTFSLECIIRDVHTPKFVQMIILG